MATYLTSNIFSDIYVGGNCVVKGTVTTLGGSAVSQWTTGGSTIYYTAGNVGIGTNAPEVKLDITDSSLVIAPTTFTGAANYGVFFRHGFATSSFYNCSILAYDHNTDNNPDGISINGYDGVSICTGANTRQERLRVTQAGNVGILTAAPGYPLHVVGDINFTGSLRQNGTVYTPSSQWTGSGGSPIYYVPFVGIGSTLTPTASLMVTGNVYVSNAIQTTNIVSAGFTSNATTTTFTCDTLAMPFVNATQVTAASSVGIGTTTPAYALDTVGDINASATLRIGGLIQPRLISSGTFTGVTTFDTVTFDLVNYNMVEIRMTMYFSTTNLRVMSSQLLDTAGTVYTANESGWQVFLTSSTASASGSGANIMNSTEIIGSAVGGFYSVIRLTGNQGLSQQLRNHWDWTTVGCYAGLGATTTLGRATIYNTSFVTMNRMRFNLSGGTMTGKYSIINYSS